MRPVLTLCFATSALLLAACASTEHRPIGPAEVKVAPRETRVVAIDDIYVDGTHTGILRTVRYGDGTRVQVLADLEGHQLGFLKSGRAWRVTAHEGEVEVSASDDREVAVAAILGRSPEGVTLRPETRIR